MAVRTDLARLRDRYVHRSPRNVPWRSRHALRRERGMDSFYHNYEFRKDKYFRGARLTRRAKQAAGFWLPVGSERHSAVGRAKGVKSSTSDARNQKRVHHSKHSAGGGHGECAFARPTILPPHTTDMSSRGDPAGTGQTYGERAVRFFRSAFGAASRSGGAPLRIVPDPAPDLSDPAYQTHLCDRRGLSRRWLFAQIPDLRNLALRFLARFE